MSAAFRCFIRTRVGIVAKVPPDELLNCLFLMGRAVGRAESAEISARETRDAIASWLHKRGATATAQIIELGLYLAEENSDENES